MYTDGGARGNPGPAAIGILICDTEGNEIVTHKDTIGTATNNIAEYCALIAGLEIAYNMNATEITCTLDSELVVKQMNGEYKIKNENMKKLYSEVEKRVRSFKKVSYTHAPRTHEKMRIADKLVNEALDEEASS